MLFPGNSRADSEKFFRLVKTKTKQPIKEKRRSSCAASGAWRWWTQKDSELLGSTSNTSKTINSVTVSSCCTGSFPRMSLKESSSFSNRTVFKELYQHKFDPAFCSQRQALNCRGLLLKKETVLNSYESIYSGVQHWQPTSNTHSQI